MQKNEVIKLTISDMGIDGEGIGKFDGVTLFVKDALIGDVVEVKVTKMKKNYGYARLLNIIESSKDRVTPECEFHRQCGGCQIQALSYQKQLEFKQNKVKNNLERIGKFTNIEMEPIIGMDNPYYYRNKAQFPVGKDKNGKIITGFYAGRTHTIIPNRDCKIGAPINKQILDCVIEYMEKNKIAPYNEETREGTVRHILIRYAFTTKEIMVCLIINKKKLFNEEELVNELKKIEGMTSISININSKNTNVILGDITKTLWGQDYITDYIGNIKYQISPMSFYQVNPVQTKKLYETALEYADLTGNETVWDLYCGIGTISLFLAQKAKNVYGVEIVPQAIEDAKNNAKINNIHNTEFIVGKAEEVLPKYYSQISSNKDEATENSCNGYNEAGALKTGAAADVIVVDPPRKGCDEVLLDTLVKMQPNKVVYVSCDSATLARDLRYLCDRGYEVEKVRGVDQFCHSGHVETVTCLHRVNS